MEALQVNKDKLNILIAELSLDELKSLRGIVSRKLAGNRILTPEDHVKMQAGRRPGKQGRPRKTANVAAVN